MSSRFEPGLAELAVDDGVARPAVLTVDELAAMLRCNRKTVYAAIARGEIPGALRIGRIVRIDRDAVLAWLSGRERAPRSRGSR